MVVPEPEKENLHRDSREGSLPEQQMEDNHSHDDVMKQNISVIIKKNKQRKTSSGFQGQWSLLLIKWLGIHPLEEKTDPETESLAARGKSASEKNGGSAARGKTTPETGSLAAWGKSASEKNGGPAARGKTAPETVGLAARGKSASEDGGTAAPGKTVTGARQRAAVDAAELTRCCLEED
eukprot:gene10801-19606_t